MEAACHRRAVDRRGVTRGVIGVLAVIAITFVGSDRLVWFDAALTGYLFGVAFAVFGVIYRLDARLRRARQHDVPRLARSQDRTRATMTRATR